MQARGGIYPRAINIQSSSLTLSKVVMHVEHALWNDYAKYGVPAMSVTLNKENNIGVRDLFMSQCQTTYSKYTCYM